MSEYDRPSINDLWLMRRYLTVDADLVEQRNEVKICGCLTVKEVDVECEVGRVCLVSRLGGPPLFLCLQGGVPLSFSSLINQSNN